MNFFLWPAEDGFSYNGKLKRPITLHVYVVVNVLSQGLVPQKLVKFNPGLSEILVKVFLSKNMQLELTKYC